MGRKIAAESREVTTQGYDFEDRRSGARYRSASVPMRIMVRASDGSKNGFHASKKPVQGWSVASGQGVFREPAARVLQDMCDHMSDVGDEDSESNAQCRSALSQAEHGRTCINRAGSCCSKVSSSPFFPGSLPYQVRTTVCKKGSCGSCRPHVLYSCGLFVQVLVAV